MTTQIVLTEDGKLIAFDPSDYCYVVNQKDVDEGKYEPRIETKRIDGDKVEMQISQLMPPLVKIR